MVNIPNLPPKEELEYKEKEFLLSLQEQLQSSKKIWFIVLLAVLLLILPGKFLLEKKFTQSLLEAARPIAINEQPYIPQELQVVATQMLPVVPGTFSAYAQVLNPNAEISAREIAYVFEFKDAAGQIIQTERGQDYLLAGESKFLLEAQVEVQSPHQVSFRVESVKWTNRKPEFEIRFEVLQKNAGVTPEGNFFVEGLVKNLQGFGVRLVEVPVVVFDRANEKPLAVNFTVLSDLKAQESRYFRVIWPTKNIDISTFRIGQIQITPSVNLLSPGLILEEGDGFPER